MNQAAPPAKPKPSKAKSHHHRLRDKGLLGASSGGFSVASGKLFPLNHSERLVLNQRSRPADELNLWDKLLGSVRTLIVQKDRLIAPN
jgi:hypothetical protein